MDDIAELEKPTDKDGLEERLREGVKTETNDDYEDGWCFDIKGAGKAMNEAADLIATLKSDKDALEKQRLDLIDGAMKNAAQVKQYREALVKIVYNPHNDLGSEARFCRETARAALEDE